MVETTFIYALNDPETGECRYVGKANDPHDRLFGDSGHLYDARNAKNTYHCATWLRSLMARGLVPHLEILQEVPKAEWKLWEQVWIKTSRDVGMDLTNILPGGDGGYCGVTTPETRAKMSASHSGEKNPMFGKFGPEHPASGKRAAEHGDKIRAYRIGKKHSPETIAKLTGKPLSPERRARISTARLGQKPTPETCGKMRNKKSGSSSGFRGVFWVRGRAFKWQVSLSVGGKRKYFGYFSDEIEAAKAYDTAAKIHHGEFAKLNFPD